MNLMIVEDELLLRTSLAMDIPWEQHGIEVTGLAANAAEALELSARKRPEIVLLDIQMPRMDGLELAALIRVRDPDVRFVVLSGHDNFAYAQKALELGVCKYLLKPAGETEIIEAVLAAADSLRLDLARRHDQSSMQRRWREHLPQLQETFLQNWLNGKYALWEVEERGRELQLELPVHGAFVVAAIDMDPLHTDEQRFLPDDRALLQFSLGRIAREVLDPVLCRVCQLSSGETAAVFLRPHPDDSAAPLLLTVHTAVTKLLTVVKECLKLTASAGISSLAFSYREVPELFRQAYGSLQERIVYGCDIAIPYQKTEAAARDVVLPLELEKQLEIALESGDEGRALATLEQLWAAGVAATLTVEEAHEHLIDISGFLARAIRRRGWSVREVAGADFVYFPNVGALATKEQANDWLKRVVLGYIAYWHKERAEAASKTIALLLQIVDREMDKDINLYAIADRLFVNASYLSRLFKRKVGKPFTTYVLEQKMERAKQLLVEGGKVGEAAIRTGFKDISYFARVFRKYWGVLPSEVKTGK